MDQPSASNDEFSAADIATSAFQRDRHPADASFAHHDHPHSDSKKKKKFSLKNLSKKQKILLGIFVVILLGAIGGSVWWFVLRTEPVVAPQVVVEEPLPTEKPIVSDMTGLPVDPKINERTVTGVMIENSPEARPQAGLLDADIVYEAVAEGGITRFLALYHDTEPKYVGPVRSARPYYLHWVKPFNGALAHVGGSPLALQLIRNYKIRDLDQFHNAGAYERISSRYAPHNAYTGIDKLQKVQSERKYKPDNFRSFARLETAQPTGTVTAGTIDFTLSGPLYNTQFEYSKKENSYGRSQAGRKHLDDKSGKQIRSDVVIALIMEKGQDGKYSTYKTTGKGTVLVFQDGKVIKGNWRKVQVGDQFNFTTVSGEPLRLNPGKVWVTAVGSKSDVKYKP